MRFWARFLMAIVLLFVPLVASAQYRDLDEALSRLNRGFGSGDPQEIVAGINPGDQVVMQFPGLAKPGGSLGRDQAAYLLDGLFHTVKPTGFEQVSTRGGRGEGQYTIHAKWAITVGGKPATRDLYIRLKPAGEGWSVLSVQSSGK